MDCSAASACSTGLADLCWILSSITDRQRVASLFFIFLAGKYLALAHMVCLADNAGGFHFLNQGRGPIIADFQVALHKAGGGALLSDNQINRLII